MPKFIAGTYELVLVRDAPFFDDSTAIRDLVERRLPWDSLDAARHWRDSVRLVDTYLEELEETPAEAYHLVEAASGSDSSTVVRRLLQRVGCTEWRSGGSLTLEADGRFERTDEIRTYCRGRVPAYTRRTQDGGLPAALQTCASWEAPAPGLVPHLTCRHGRYWDGMYPYRYVGDTLRLGSDCDGSETYVLRNPKRPAALTVARSSDVTQLEEC